MGSATLEWRQKKHGDPSDASNRGPKTNRDGCTEKCRAWGAGEWLERRRVDARHCPHWARQTKTLADDPGPQTSTAGFKLYCDMHSSSHSNQECLENDFFTTLDTSDVFLANTNTPTAFDSTQQFSEICRQLQSKHLQLLVSSALQVNWRIFRDGVSPCWEDPQNTKGGKWALSLVDVDPADILRRLQTLVGAILRRDFPSYQLINGVVLSIKDWGYRLSVWTSKVPPKVTIAKGCKWLRANLKPKYAGWYVHESLNAKHSSVRTVSGTAAAQDSDISAKTAAASISFLHVELDTKNLPAHACAEDISRVLSKCQDDIQQASMPCVDDFDSLMRHPKKYDEDALSDADTHT